MFCVKRRFEDDSSVCFFPAHTASYQKLILAVTCLVLFVTPLFASVDPGEIYSK